MLFMHSYTYRGQPLQRAARKNGAVRCPMGERELLAGTGKEHRVLTDEIPGAHDREADAAGAA